MNRSNLLPLLLLSVVAACGPTGIGVGLFGTDRNDGAGTVVALSLSIDQRPAKVTNETTATFTFSTNLEGVTFSAQYDQGPLVEVSNPHVITGVERGTHELLVIASKGPWLAISTYVWEMDPDPPVTRFSKTPPEFTNETSGTFEFDAESGSSFMGSLDGQPFTVISRPHVVGPALTEGEHVFEVVATDSAGNVETSPASYRWTVDTTPPDAVPFPSATPRGAHDVALEWQVSGDDRSGLTGYRIYYDTDDADSPFDGTGAGEGTSPITVGFLTELTLTRLESCLPYFFAISAVDRAGNESELSVLAPTRTGCGGDGTFRDHGSIEVGPLPLAAVAEDFDADGIADLAVANGGDGTVSILLGNGADGRGDGTFREAPGSPIFVGGIPVDIVAGSLTTESDPFIDLVVASWATDTIAVLRGNGDGSFGLDQDDVIESRFGIQPTVLSLADINRDGILDLFNTTAQLLGQGTNGRSNGSFEWSGDSTGCCSISLAQADFDSDGVDDVAVGRLAPIGISVRLSGGDDRFVPLDGVPLSLVTGDFNADGIVDLAATLENSGGVAVLLGRGTDGQGDGRFSSPEEFPTSSGPVAMISADLDWDDVEDLVIACAQSGELVSLRGTGQAGRGDSRFELPRVFADVTSPTRMISGDWNDDDIVDLALLEEAGVVRIFLGEGVVLEPDGSFGLPTSVYTGVNSEYYFNALESADINDDGRVDLVERSYLECPTMLGEGSDGRGVGRFESARSFGPGSSSPSTDYLVTDLDRDDILDIAYAAGRDLFVLRGLGVDGQATGEFEPIEWTGRDRIAIHALGTVDLNADGRTDLIELNLSPPGVAVYLEQDFSGSADAGPEVTGGIGLDAAFDLAIADWNGDGLPDLALPGAAAGQGHVSILFQDRDTRSDGHHGAGTFTRSLPPIAVTPNPMAQTARAIDLNKDGLKDLLILSSDSAEVNVGVGRSVVVLRSLGDGAFDAPRIVYEPGSGLGDLAVADFDRDDRVDLAVTHQDGSDQVAILLGTGLDADGHPTFGPPEFFAAGPGPGSMAADDFDDDGALDLAIINKTGFTVSILLGQGVRR